MSTQRFVILLHGLIRTKGSMAFLAKHLDKAGFKVINYGYKSRKYSIETQADLLHEFLEQSGVTKSSSLNFVTHSLGSIIVRKLALKYSNHWNFARAVMLGPPNQGSKLAATLNKGNRLERILGPAFKELTQLDLAPASDILAIGIIAGTAARSAPAILRNSDGIVGLEETKLTGAKDLIVLPGIHSFLMYSPRVIEQVIHFLRLGKFDVSSKKSKNKPK